MSQPWEVIDTKCRQCGHKIRVPAGRRRRAIRLGRPVVDFCSRTCNALHVATVGSGQQAAQLKQKQIEP